VRRSRSRSGAENVSQGARHRFMRAMIALGRAPHLTSRAGACRWPRRRAVGPSFAPARRSTGCSPPSSALPPHCTPAAARGAAARPLDPRGAQGWRSRADGRVAGGSCRAQPALDAHRDDPRSFKIPRAMSAHGETLESEARALCLVPWSNDQPAARAWSGSARSRSSMIRFTQPWRAGRYDARCRTLARILEWGRRRTLPPHDQRAGLTAHPGAGGPTSPGNLGHFGARAAALRRTSPRQSGATGRRP
jgi:hypothetical protein